MAGPTPVSALIHAATMVVAGVYLGARLYPVFFTGFSIGTTAASTSMAAVGGITVIIGAALAFVQDDIKKVLAYSTISQLGYMVMALGVGAWTAAVFHLFTHAFFKADLFLGAGSVSHSGSHHSFDMKKDMGGLRKYMPQTFWTFIIGTLALAGIFPLAGFWSKDEILVNAGDNGYQVFLVVGLVGAFMTAAYMTRCVYLTFFGEYRGGHATPTRDATHVEGDELVEHDLADDQDDAAPASAARRRTTREPAREQLRSSPVRSGCSSFFAVFAGLLNAPGIEKFTEWFEPRFAFPEINHAEFSGRLAIVSVAHRAARRRRRRTLYYWKALGPQRLSERNTARATRASSSSSKVLPRLPLHRHHRRSIKGPIARGVYWFNQHVIDNVLNYTGRGARCARPVHLRLHRPAGRRRHRQRHRRRHRRSRRRGAPDPDRSAAVLRT